jgi:hypothetical protein
MKPLERKAESDNDTVNEDNDGEERKVLIPVKGKKKR